MQTTARTPITKELAQTILTKLATKVIDQPNKRYEGVEITNISFADGDGNPFKYENSDDNYAIVNLRAINRHQLNLAVADFKAGNYDEATNRNMSMRASIADAQSWGKKTIGVLTCQLVDLKDEHGNPTGEQAIMPYSFVPEAVVATAKVDFMALVDAEEIPLKTATETVK